MKKAKYLLLLAPSLFLLTSCGRSTATDLISEADAKKFISEHFTIGQSESGLSSGWVSWSISKDDNHNAGKWISDYIDTSSTPLEGTGGAPIDGDRITTYKTTDLSTIGSIGHDAVVHMNSDIYSLLYKSEQNDKDHYLTYKYWGAGLLITSNFRDTQYKETRSHYYDKTGHESMYQVAWATKDYNFSVTINFQYQ